MSSQSKVAVLFLLALVSIFVFVSFLGKFSPFGNYKRFVIGYNFAGGLEEGSHVRLMGIKVGKIEKVEFSPGFKTKEGKPVHLKVHVKVKESAFPAIKADSHFYINLAGIIGEKYLEIAPGSEDSEGLVEGGFVRGVDPPRIDQLISQGYALAGKILSVVEDNEDSFSSTVGSIDSLVSSLDSILVHVEKLTKDKKYNQLVPKITKLTSELTVFFEEIQAGDAKRALRSMRKILTKLEGIEESDVREFLQEEGIKARVAL